MCINQCCCSKFSMCKNIFLSTKIAKLNLCGFISYLCRKSAISKLVSATFYQIFIFHHMIALQNYEKNFLFHLKSSFPSRDIQIFVFPSSPLFLTVSHSHFRSCSKINLKVYDVIKYLKENLIAHFV